MECQGDLLLDRRDLLVQAGDQALQARPHTGDHDWLLQEGVQLVAELGPRTDQPITMDQALLKFGVDLGRWGSGGGLEPRAKLCERLGINRISLGAFEQCFGEIVGLSRIDDGDGQASGTQASS